MVSNIMYFERYIIRENETIYMREMQAMEEEKDGEPKTRNLGPM